MGAEGGGEVVPDRRCRVLGDVSYLVARIVPDKVMRAGFMHLQDQALH